MLSLFCLVLARRPRVVPASSFSPTALPSVASVPLGAMLSFFSRRDTMVEERLLTTN
jgi:hypothetical protein